MPGRSARLRPGWVGRHRGRATSPADPAGELQPRSLVPSERIKAHYGESHHRPPRCWNWRAGPHLPQAGIGTSWPIQKAGSAWRSPRASSRGCGAPRPAPLATWGRRAIPSGVTSASEQAWVALTRCPAADRTAGRRPPAARVVVTSRGARGPAAGGRPTRVLRRYSPALVMLERRPTILRIGGRPPRPPGPPAYRLRRRAS
jgi:hypothetical protein